MTSQVDIYHCLPQLICRSFMISELIFVDIIIIIFLKSARLTNKFYKKKLLQHDVVQYHWVSQKLNYLIFNHVVSHHVVKGFCKICL
jgi:hypothetical protein